MDLFTAQKGLTHENSKFQIGKPKIQSPMFIKEFANISH